MIQLRIITGLVKLILVNGEVKYGGVVVKLDLKPKVAKECGTKMKRNFKPKQSS